MENTKRKRGFTLVELITVIAMLLLLMGAVTSSVSGARRRAKIQQAISEAQELTNAILAYENFANPGEASPLENKATGEGWKEAGESELAFVLGKEAMPNGRNGNVPVLFNGAVRGGKLRDPWGSAKFLACLKKIHRIDEKMKTASGERLQKLADQKAILELEMDQLWTVGMGHQIEYREEV